MTALTFFPPTVSLLPLLLLLNLLHSSHSQRMGLYLPPSYPIPPHSEECLYERIANAGEHITASVFIVSGDELRAAVVFEGPVAPDSISIGKDKEFVGAELIKHVDKLKRGKMLVNVQKLLDFENEEEKYHYDDQLVGDHADVEHHEGDDEGMEVLSAGKTAEVDDDYERVREAKLKRQIHEEAEMDDDFAKLQMDHERERYERDMKRDLEQGGEEGVPHHRRLSEEAEADDHLLSGEPWQHTEQIQHPGWYRLCVRSVSYSIEVEMELRKSSIYGHVEKRTGHVPSLEEVELHSEIHDLYEKEEDPEIPKDSIKEEDLHATREQIRILERIYQEIISKQLEERRTWNWRTLKNQHSYSHMVLGNLMETVVYMGITGWQVYTIRKWFGSGPALGR